MHLLVVLKSSGLKLLGSRCFRAWQPYLSQPCPFKHRHLLYKEDVVDSRMMTTAYRVRSCCVWSKNVQDGRFFLS